MENPDEAELTRRGFVVLAASAMGATPEEGSAVMLVVDKINEGLEVWGEVTTAEHSTIDAGPDNARIHSIEFDVFYR